MTRLTNIEKETIITFDETPEDGYIFTYNKVWQKHLEKRLGLKIDMDNGYGGKQYRIPKKRIRMPLSPRNLSPEAKKRLSERGKALARKRFSKPPSIVTTVKQDAQTSGMGKTTNKKKEVKK